MQERSGGFFENAGERLARRNADAHAGIAGVFAKIPFPTLLGGGQDPLVINVERVP
jgi:hypothetical protein